MFSDWIAFEPHYLAYSWSADERRLRQYVDGQLVREEDFPDGFVLPTISRADFRLGSNTDGALDELRIFDRETGPDRSSGSVQFTSRRSRTKWHCSIF